MRIPSYRKHSSGNARVSINGRDYLLGKYGTKQSKERYNRLLSEWMTELMELWDELTGDYDPNVMPRILATSEQIKAINRKIEAHLKSEAERRDRMK